MWTGPGPGWGKVRCWPGPVEPSGVNSECFTLDKPTANSKDRETMQRSEAVPQSQEGLRQIGEPGADCKERLVDLVLGEFIRLSTGHLGKKGWGKHRQSSCI